jgi:hypothetical protein
MAADRGAHAGAIALNEVEHARRNARIVHDLGKDRGIAGAFFRRLEHHGVACGHRRGNLERDLVERPVPGVIRPMTPTGSWAT